MPNQISATCGLIIFLSQTWSRWNWKPNTFKGWYFRFWMSFLRPTMFSWGWGSSFYQPVDRPWIQQTTAVENANSKSLSDVPLQTLAIPHKFLIEPRDLWHSADQNSNNLNFLFGQILSLLRCATMWKFKSRWTAFSRPRKYFHRCQHLPDQICCKS